MKVVITPQPRYALPARGEVRLSIDAGQFQGGFAQVRIGQDLLTDGRLPLNVRLGDAADLQRRRVRVRAVISDHSRQTNRVEVSYALAPGPAGQNIHTFEDEVEEDAGSVEFQTTIRLVSAPDR